VRIAGRWIVTGRSKCVSLLTCAHACSQSCSQGQGYSHQGVMYCCEVCEAKFPLFLEINKYIGRGVSIAVWMGRCEDRDFRLTLLTRAYPAEERGAGGSFGGGVGRGSGEAKSVSDVRF
jgi:hypothetical protein